ncbi:MAG: hypothetical protein U5K77_02425 [Candidatus Saccharibacteria bacterium]|nr:hypothetical protein [Candidatus Saccharibacteria bacterium]
MKTLNIIGASWGLAGITLIIGAAIVRLSVHVINSLSFSFNGVEWLILIAWCSFMLIGEGYYGFQKKFSPRVADRLRHLLHYGQTKDIIFAPLYCMSYFNAARKRIITSWLLTAGILVLVFSTKQLPQPLQGIIDVGVVLGLLYGLVWIYIFTFKTFVHPQGSGNSTGQ